VEVVEDRDERVDELTFHFGVFVAFSSMTEEEVKK
jgi:hypothetical protein